MEGNGYFMPLRNSRRYTPYEFDLKMSHNEDRMNRLGKIIDQDIYFTLMSRKKTPTVTGRYNLQSVRYPKTVKSKFKYDEF